MASLKVRLACRHWTTINSGRTTLADMAYCRFHGTQDIAYISFQEWRVVCLTCTYGAWCNQAETGARRRAAKHEDNRGHECVVIYDDKIKPTAKKDLIRTAPVVYDRDIFGNPTDADAPPPF